MKNSHYKNTQKYKRKKGAGYGKNTKKNTAVQKSQPILEEPRVEPQVEPLEQVNSKVEKVYTRKTKQPALKQSSNETIVHLPEQLSNSNITKMPNQNEEQLQENNIKKN